MVENTKKEGSEGEVMVIINTCIQWLAVKFVSWLLKVKVWMGKVSEKHSRMKWASEIGEFSVDHIVDVVMTFVVAGSVIAALWDTFVGTDTQIQALTGTDQATVVLKLVYPVAVMIGGIYLVVRLMKKAQTG